MTINSNLLSLIDDKTKIEILRKNWMSHDAKSQMCIVREFGWEKGNKLNKLVIEEMGKTSMQRLINALHISQINNMKDFLAICSTAMEFFYPYPIFSYRFDQISDTKAVGIIEKCSAMDNVKKIGVEKQYDCGCFSMRSGWYKALGIKVNEELIKCIKNGDSTCEISCKIKSWKK